MEKLINFPKDRSLDKNLICIEPLAPQFSVCKVMDYSKVDCSKKFCFPQKTDEENSLVCMTQDVPDNTTDRDDGWKAFRIRGTIDFSLIGILAGISDVLCRSLIGIFAVSTFNTDYILVKEEDFHRAIDVLREAGYIIDG